MNLEKSSLTHTSVKHFSANYNIHYTRIVTNANIASYFFNFDNLTFGNTVVQTIRTLTAVHCCIIIYYFPVFFIFILQFTKKSVDLSFLKCFLHIFVYITLS